MELPCAAIMKFGASLEGGAIFFLIISNQVQKKNSSKVALFSKFSKLLSKKVALRRFTSKYKMVPESWIFLFACESP